LCRLDLDHLSAAFYCLGLDCLLRTGLQISRALRFGAHPLNRCQHVRLLRQKRIPKIGRPLNVAC
jgi:hypothetical protein